MEMIKSQTGLKRAIQELQDKQSNDWSLLKEQFNSTSKLITPGKVAKIAFNELISTPSLRSSLLKAGFGLLAGFIGTKLLVRKSSNPLLKLVAGSIMGVATSTQANKAISVVKSIGSSVLRKIFKPREAAKENGHFV